MVAVISDKNAPVGLRVNKLQQFLEKNKAAIFQALPRHLTPDRMIRVVLTNFRKTPKLLNCTPESIFASITQASSLGLETDGVLGQAYLVPYKTECTLIPGYKGLIVLCRRSRQISTFDVQSVHKGDLFTYQLGDNPFIRHTPNEADPERDEKPITHVYAVAKMRDGGIQRQVWSTPKIESHKKKFSSNFRYAESSGKRDSTWHTSWEAMAQKTVLRSLCKLLPMSPEAMELICRDEAIDAEFSHPLAAPTTLSLGELDQHLGGPAVVDDDDSFVDDGEDAGEDATDLDAELATLYETIDAEKSPSAVTDLVLDAKARFPVDYHEGIDQRGKDRVAALKAPKQKTL